MNQPDPTSPGDDALLAHGLPPGSRARSRRLANGLRIVAAEVPESRQLRLVGAVGVGYLDEPTERRGLAHLLEHGLFLGSARYPAADELSAWIGELGGRYNAHTDERVTDVHLHLPPSAAADGVARLVDLLGRPRLDAGRIANEVEVLDAEFRARLDDPALHRLAALGRLCRPGHPARLCHAGHRGTLDGDAPTLAAELHAFHRHHYRAERLALAMLGPLPLDEQLALLERHGASLPSGASASGPAAWRWDGAGAVTWSPPRASDRVHATTLELIWPLPETVASTHAPRLAALAARLADGQLAAGLQAEAELGDLVIDLAPRGTGSALAMRLELEDPAPAIAPLLAACRHALGRALDERLAPAPPPPIDLDAWPRRQACRLAGPTPSPSPPGEAALAPWLAGDRCRVLWQQPSARGGTWSRLAETGTRYRPLPLPRQADDAPPGRPAPDLVASPPQAAEVEVSGPRLQDTRLSLWWGGPAWSNPVYPANWCLGWAADPAGREARLHRWRSRTLALRQAAAARGLSLDLAADARGDWLIALGDPDTLGSLVEQALDAWTTDQRDAARASPPTGLLAQRLLQRLEIPPPTAETPPRRLGSLQQPPLLGWAGGELAPQAALEAAERFAERLPAPAALPSPAIAPPEAGNESWLPPQGGERAVMLAVTGRDASPRSRWLLQLLAACHDAPFHAEMRQRRGFGYVAAVRYREASGWPRLGYVVQSPHATVATLREAILDFLDRQGTLLARLDPAELERRRRGLMARQGPPETHREAIERTWQALWCRVSLGDEANWQAPWEAELAALEGLGIADLGEQVAALARGELARHWWCHAPT